MSAVRFLAVSPPSHVPVNRAVFRDLAVRHGIEVHLAVPRRLFLGGRWNDTPTEAAAPYRITLLDLVGNHGRLRFVKGLGALTREWNPTHILVDSDPASVLAWQALRHARGRPVWALTAENLQLDPWREIASGVRSMKPGRAVGMLATLALRARARAGIDRVFTLSRDGTKVLERMGFAGRVTQIPLGFDPAIFRIQPSERITATRSRLGLTRPTVAYFGRLTPEKGVHLLIDALASLRGLSWQLLLDNFADYRTAYADELRALIARRDIADRIVHFDGGHEDMPDFMNAADIVVLPSVSTPKWREQYGRVLPEAMACGKAVVGSDSGSIPELVDAHGKIFPEADPAALAAAIAELLRSSAEDRARAGAAASRYAHERLSITAQSDIWARLLLEPARASSDSGR